MFRGSRSFPQNNAVPVENYSNIGGAFPDSVLMVKVRLPDWLEFSVASARYAHLPDGT
jgi:hypothetical protein